MKNFGLPENYKTNPETYFDDTNLKDEYQKEVYEYALSIVEKMGYKTILDFGCGSGYKLIKYFDSYDTIGIDLPPTVAFLRNKYPHKIWTTDINNPILCDVFITSDAIEHMENPNILLDFIEICKPKEIIISTPDKNLICPPNLLGSPYNIHHVREWTFEEFRNYIESRFDIINHFISNENQITQLIHAQIKD